MNTHKIIVGVDVSADELVCATLPRQAGIQPCYSNSARGVKALVGALQRLLGPEPGEVHVIMEATGNLHVRLQDALWEASVPCSLLQPLVMTHYARMKGTRNKTDAVDAALLARYGAEQSPAPSAPIGSVRRQIKQLGTTIRALIIERTRLRNQVGALRRLPSPDAACVRELSGMLKDVERRIARLEKRQAAVVAAHYGEEVALLCSIKGIGSRTATALVAYAGDLSGFGSPRQLVAYIGTNPARRYSGTSLHVNGGISKQGNRHLRTLFYMAALTARRHNASCRALYDRLVAKGKTKKQALIAVASKLIRQAWGVLHHRQPFIDGFGLQPLTS
ncbi:IS110 family transposase [soil metagenome]